jgi:glycosyltransferase involved in cell wall biosynthesis
MRVCLVGPTYPYRGGISHYTSLRAAEFGFGHEVKIVNFSRLYPSFLFPGRTQYDTSDSPLRVETDRIIDCLDPFSWYRAGSAAAAFRPDLTVFQWWHPFFGPAYRTVCGALRRGSDSPRVFLCHNVLPHESSVFDRMLIRVAFGGADAFLVQSNEDGENLKALRPEPTMAVNPLPVYDFFDAGRFDRGAARVKLGLEGPVILFFGYIRAYKGLADLIEAMPQIVERLPLTLLVVGEFYEARDAYDRRIRKLEIGKHIRIVDEYVPNEDVEIYFKASDLCVLPYRSATQSAIVQTAYGFSKPVVVTAVGGLPDVVDDGRTGYVVPAGDTRALADAVVRFFEEGAAGRMADNIRGEADRFSWRRCVDTLLELGSRVGKRVNKV